MSLQEKFKKEFDQCFRGELTNVPELENPVLIVLEYSPRDDQRPVSIAFDYLGAPKCWLTEPTVRKINDRGPKPYPKYKKFTYKQRIFHPYSVKSFARSIFEDIREFKTACQSLYQHVKQD